MKSERGNILFLILLAVVLFAALSYAVTSSLRGGGADSSDEKTQAQAADLLNYFASLDLAVQRMMMTGNVKDYELNFYYLSASNFVSGSNDNTNCTASRCRVFDPAGGAVSGRKLNDFSKNKVGSMERIFYSHVPGAGTSAPEIMFGIMGVPTKLCREINKRSGINDIPYGVNLPESASTIMYEWAIPAGAIPNTGNTMSNLTANIGSLSTFCACRLADLATCEADANRHTIFHVLVTR